MIGKEIDQNKKKCKRMSSGKPSEELKRHHSPKAGHDHKRPDSNILSGIIGNRKHSQVHEYEYDRPYPAEYAAKTNIKNDTR